MRRLLIAVVLLPITLILCAVPATILEKQTTRMLEQLNTATLALEREDTAATADAIHAFCTDFKEQSRWWALFFPHEKLDAVEESAALLPLLQQKKAAHLAEELARCIYRVEHLQQSERLTLANIF